MSEAYPSHYVASDGAIVLEDFRIRFEGGEASLELRVAAMLSERYPAFDCIYSGPYATFEIRHQEYLYGITVDAIENEVAEFLAERRDSVALCWRTLGSMYDFSWRIDRGGAANAILHVSVGDPAFCPTELPHFATKFPVSREHLLTARRDFATLVRLANSYYP